KLGAARSIHGAAPNSYHRRYRARRRSRPATFVLAAVRLQSAQSEEHQGRVGCDVPGLRSDPAIGASSIFVLAPNKEAAQSDLEKLSKLPEVSSVKTIESFVPSDQQPKLAAIRQLATVLDPVLRPDPNKKPPTDADNVAALKAAVDALKQSA